MRTLTISKLIIEALLLNNVKRIYGIIGTSIVDFIDTLYDYREKIDFITTRHEQVAVSAADGEARTTGKIGVAAVHAGPGFLNSLLSLGISMKDRIPVLLISGGVRRRLKKTDAWLEIDQETLSKPLTNYYANITKPNEALSILTEAFQKLQGPPRGPVVIEVAEDLWKEKITVTDEDIKALQLKNNETETPPKEIIKEILEKMSEAEKPLILISGEATIPNKLESALLLKLSEMLGAYIIVSGNARGACPEDHPRCLGRVGFGGGNIVADGALEASDFLLVLGNEFDDTTTYAYTLLPEGDIVVISLDPAVEKRPKYYEYLKYDPLMFLKILYLEAENSKYHQQKESWDQLIIKLKKQWNTMLEEALSRKYEKTVNPSKFFKLLDEKLPRNRIITGGQGTHILYAYDFIKIFKPGGFLAATNLGAMSYAFPAAIGAKLANPDDEVIAIVGDGEFMMTVHDLETIKREQIPVKIIVVNDNSYRVLYLRQLLQKSGRIYETLLGNPDFVMLAESFGINGIKIDNDNKIEEGVNAITSSTNQPLLIELVIDPNDIPPFNIQQTLKMST
jgi:acetolactate synthase-1/2/3 large subunit